MIACLFIKMSSLALDLRTYDTCSVGSDWFKNDRQTIKRRCHKRRVKVNVFFSLDFDQNVTSKTESPPVEKI